MKEFQGHPTPRGYNHKYTQIKKKGKASPEVEERGEKGRLGYEENGVKKVEQMTTFIEKTS